MARTKLRVGVAFTKQKPNAIELQKAFAKGISYSGDRPFLIRIEADIKRHMPYDYMVQHGEWNFGLNKLRGAIHDYCEAQQKVRKIVTDIGFINNERWKKNSVSGYFAIGFDKFKSAGDYCNRNSPPDRWNKLGIDIEPWRDSGDHVLVIGQMDNGVSTKGQDFVDWAKRATDIVHRQTGRPVVYRPHPNEKVFQHAHTNFDKVSSRGREIEKDLKNAWCTITMNSNAVVESLVRGIPAIATDQLCIAYDMCGHRFEDVVNPLMPDREQFFYDLAYAQWTIREAEKGLPWRHLIREG